MIKDSYEEDWRLDDDLKAIRNAGNQLMRKSTQGFELLLARALKDVNTRAPSVRDSLDMKNSYIPAKSEDGDSDGGNDVLGEARMADLRGGPLTRSLHDRPLIAPSYIE